MIEETLAHWGDVAPKTNTILRNLVKMQQRQYVLFGLVIRKPSLSAVFTQGCIFSLPFCTY